MRKLSKKISMLMVLAMLVSLFSGVVSASAASSWTFFNKTKKDSIVAQSKTETYKMESNEFADFDMFKDGKTIDTKVYTVKYETSDADIVWVDAKNGKLRADKYGTAEVGDTAKVTAVITNKTTKVTAKRWFVIEIVDGTDYDIVADFADEAFFVGDKYALAATVTADGKAVDAKVAFAVDGAAITEFAPAAAGEYTIVATATVDGEVVATEKFAVVVAAKEFSAEATGVKEITVYGDFAKDAKFTVKKGTQNVSFTATVAEDGKSAVLALANKLTKGTYTVSYGDAKVDIAAEDEKADEIIIFEDGGQILTDSSKYWAYIHYDVLNQYGESVRKVFDPTWTVTADSFTANARNGIITIYKASKFDFNDMVVLTGVVTGYGFAESVTATMHVGLEQNIDSVKVLGLVKENTTDLISEVPASYIGGPYYLVFGIYDNAGYQMEFNTTTEAKAEADLEFISLNPLLAKFDDDIDVEIVYIDGVAYGAVKVNKPTVEDQVRKGGVVEVSITSKKTGKNTPYTVRVVSEQILDSFKVYAPDSLTIRNAKENSASEYYLGFEALDTTGEKITDFRALYKAVQFSDSSVKLFENNDGTAGLKYTVNKANIGSTDGYDAPAVFTVIVPGSGKSDNVRLNIKPDRHAASIANLAFKWGKNEYIVEENSINIGFGNDKDEPRWIELNDQYDEVISLVRDGNWLGATDLDVLFDEGKYIGVRATESTITVNTTGATTVLTDGTVIFDVYTQKSVTLTANNIPASKKTCMVEFALYDYVLNPVSGLYEYKLVSGSDKSFPFYVVDITQIVQYNINQAGARWWASMSKYSNPGHTMEYNVSGVLANGMSVDLVNSTSNYYVMYKAETATYGIFDTIASATSGAAITVDPALQAGVNASEIFFDYSQPSADKTKYADRNFKYNVTATIYGNDDKVRGNASTTLEVSDRYAYDVSLTFNDDWAISWRISLSGDKTTAVVKANNGAIEKAVLDSVFKGVTDYYGDNNVKPITCTITKLNENSNGLNPGDLKLALGTGTNYLVNAEIGDTFVATYTNGGLSHTITFTVGSDLDAYFDGSNFSTGTWR